MTTTRNTASATTTLHFITRPARTWDEVAYSNYVAAAFADPFDALYLATKGR